MNKNHQMKEEGEPDAPMLPHNPREIIFFIGCSSSGLDKPNSSPAVT